VSGETYRDRWISEVFRTPLITDSVRVALLAIAPEMDEDGLVALRRADLAARLDRTDRRTGDRIAAAIEAGFLKRLSRGQRNGPGQYRGTLPDSRSSGHPGGPKNGAVLGTPGGPEENSLQDSFQPEENSGLQDTRGASRQPFDPSVFRTPGGPEEEARIYKDRARAHSNGDRTTHHHDGEHAGGDSAVVVPLFEEIENPSLRSHTAERSSVKSTHASDDDAFDAFWAIYPRKVAKGAARKAWAKAMKDGADPAEVITGARRYATDPRRVEADIRYTAHPATWLHAERWADEPAPAPAPEPARAANGHRPWTNPTDQSVYYEDL
jgi:hypothetical protein